MARRIWGKLTLASVGLASTGLAATTFGARAAMAASLEHRLEAVQSLTLGRAAGDATGVGVSARSLSRVRFEDGWTARVAIRAEAFVDGAGPGTLDTYAPVSRPLELGKDGRLEIDEAVLAWREGGTRLTFGKQTFAWGVLDGVQVTDRLDPVRRREGLFAAQRPDRIARWAARAEFEAGAVGWDAALIADGTADQLASDDDAFAIRAPRLRGGLSPDSPSPPVSIDPPASASVAVRARRGVGAGAIQGIVIHGPETEPVLTPDSTGAVALTYPKRTLIGAAWDQSDGPRVWRLEAAVIPDQPVNLAQPDLPIERRTRWLAGVGLDVSLPGEAVLNVQLALDHVAGPDLVRPEADLIGTARVQRPLGPRDLTASVEVIGSLTDGDGALRPAIRWQVNDHFRLEAGADLVWGPEEGLLGQFGNADRLWLRTKWAL